MQYDINGGNTKDTYQISILIFAVFLIYLGLGVVLPVYPLFLEFIQAGNALDYGISMGSFILGQIIFSPFIGKLSDSKLSRKPFIYSAVVGLGLGNFVIVIAVRDVFSLVVVRLIQGILMGGLLPICEAYVSEISNPKFKEKNLGYILAGASFGFAFGPLLGGLFYLIGGFMITFIFAITLSFISSFLIKGLISESPKLIHTRYKSTFFEQNDLIPIYKHRSFLPSFVPGGLFLFLVVLLVGFMDYWSWSIIEPSFVFYFLNQINLTSFQYSIFLTINGLVVGISQIVIGKFFYRTNKILLTIFGSFLHFIGYFMLLFANSFEKMLVISLLNGLAMGLLLASLISIISNISPAESRGQAFGLFYGFSQIFSLIGPIVGGLLSQYYHINLLFMISSLSMLLITLLLFLILLKFRTNNEVGFGFIFSSSGEKA